MITQKKWNCFYPFWELDRINIQLLRESNCELSEQLSRLLVRSKEYQKHPQKVLQNKITIKLNNNQQSRAKTPIIPKIQNQ